MKAIAHPTDFSQASVAAFEHALRLAVQYRARLDILHVKPRAAAGAWDEFPHVRDTLERWRLLPAGAARADIEGRLGTAVRKVEIDDRAAEHGVASFIARHRPDLVVMATHAAASQLGSHSVSEAIARDTHLPALFVGPAARPFVDSATGALRLGSIVFGVATSPPPQHAVETLARLLGSHAAATRFVHAGERPPRFADAGGAPAEVETVAGAPVDALLAAAERHAADLIVMATEGRHGVLDALRGSTTERVLHAARCPVLALPA